MTPAATAVRSCARSPANARGAAGQPPGARPLPLRHALALGLLHGPAELLPVSSSAHITLIPLLAGWPYGGLPARQRKSFEVALHAGTALGLLPCWRSATRPRGFDGSSSRPITFGVLAAAAAPPALAGYALHGPVERRLGTPRTIAAGLAAGSLAILWAEARARRLGAAGGGPRRDAPPRVLPFGAALRRAAPDRAAPRRAGTRHAAAGRAAHEATVADGLALGAAQALALAPGVSRSGATFAAARARGFAAGDAERLSLAAGLPVLGGAALLQAAKQLRRGVACGERSALAAGAAGAVLSTLLTPKLLDARRRARAVLPCAVYRVALAGVVIKKSLTSTAGDGGILGAVTARS